MEIGEGKKAEENKIITCKVTEEELKKSERKLIKLRRWKEKMNGNRTEKSK